MAPRVPGELTANGQHRPAAPAGAATATADAPVARVTGLGRSVGANEADSTIVRPLPIADRDIVDLIVAGGPSVRSADASSDAANASVRAAKAQYFPTINATGGYSVYAQPATRGPLIDGGNAWQFRVGVVYPIFDGFQREDGVSRADAEADAAGRLGRDQRRARAEERVDDGFSALGEVEEGVLEHGGGLDRRMMLQAPAGVGAQRGGAGISPHIRPPAALPAQFDIVDVRRLALFWKKSKAPFHFL